MPQKPAERKKPSVQLTQNGVFDFDIEDDNDDVQQNPVDLLRRYLRPIAPPECAVVEVEEQQNGDNGCDVADDTLNAHDGALPHASTLRSEDMLETNTAIENGVSNNNIEIDIGKTVKNDKTSCCVQPRNPPLRQTDDLSDGSREDTDHCYFNNWIELEAVSIPDFDYEDGTKHRTISCEAMEFQIPSTAAESSPADGIRGDIASDNIVYPTAARMMEIFVAKTCPRPPQETHVTESISTRYETTTAGVDEREHAQIVSNAGNCHNNTADDVYSGDKSSGTRLPRQEQNKVAEQTRWKDNNMVDVNTGARTQMNSAPVQRKVTFAPESIVSKAGRSSQYSLRMSLMKTRRHEDSVAKKHCEGIANSSGMSRSEWDKTETASSAPKRREKLKSDHMAKSRASSSTSPLVSRSEHAHSKSVSYPLKKRSLSTADTLTPSKLDSSSNGDGLLTSRSVRSRLLHTSNPDEGRSSKDSLNEQNTCQIALRRAKEAETRSSVTKIGQTSEILGVMNSPVTELSAEDFACLRGYRPITEKVMNAFIALINKRNRAYFDVKRQKSSLRTGGHLGMRQILRKNCEHFRGVEAIFNMRRPRTHMFDTLFFQRLRGNKYVYNAEQHSLLKVGLNIDDMDLILTPINCGNCHWALVAIDLRNRIVIYMNSMLQKDVTEVIPRFKQWLCDEVGSVMGYDVMKRLDITNWSYSINPLFTPLQTDSASGGLFTLYIAEYLERAQKPDFTQTDIPMMRQRARIFLEMDRLPIE